MTSGIYCYIDKKTDRVIYVGKDSYIDKNTRHKEHFSPSRKNDQPINRALQNNPQRYKYKILKKGDFSESLLNALEVIYIERYGTFRNRKGYGDSYGFNFTVGGEGAKGSKRSEKTLQRMSKSQTTTGFQNIYKHKSPDSKNGFIWRYQYSKTTNKVKAISRANLFDLKEKVLAENLPWKIVDEAKARKTCKENGYDFEELKKYVGIKRNKEEEKQLKSIRNSQATTNTGFYKINLCKDSSCSSGFIWGYRYTKNKKRKRISRVNLIKLKEAVLEKNLKWLIIDEKRAKITCEKYNYDFEKLK